MGKEKSRSEMRRLSMMGKLNSIKKREEKVVNREWGSEFIDPRGRFTELSGPPSGSLLHHIARAQLMSQVGQKAYAFFEHPVTRRRDEREARNDGEYPYGIKINQLTDPDQRVYHTRFELSTEYVSRMLVGQSTGVCPFADKVFAIHGVIEVAVKGFSFQVEKATAFSWDEIHPKIVEIVGGLDAEFSGLRQLMFR